MKMGKVPDCNCHEFPLELLNSGLVPFSSLKEMILIHCFSTGVPHPRCEVPMRGGSSSLSCWFRPRAAWLCLCAGALENTHGAPSLGLCLSLNWFACSGAEMSPLKPQEGWLNSEASRKSWSSFRGQAGCALHCTAWIPAPGPTSCGGVLVSFPPCWVPVPWLGAAWEAFPAFPAVNP